MYLPILYLPLSPFNPIGPLTPGGPGKPAAPVRPLSPGGPRQATNRQRFKMQKANKQLHLLNQKHFSLLHFMSLYNTCQASVSLWPPGAPLRWTALTEVEVALVVIQGVVLMANNRGISALWVIVWKAMTWIGGLLCGGRRVGLHRFCSRHYLVGLGHAGGQRAVHGDLRDGLLGVLVLWFLCSLSFNAGHSSECNHCYSH